MDLSYKILDFIQLILCIESAPDNYSSEASDNIERAKKGDQFIAMVFFCARRNGNNA